MRLARAGLHGVFAVYKPPGVAWRTVRNSVETHLLRDLNSFERPAPRRLVRFLPSTVEGKDGKELTMTVTQLPAMADHPLVSGPIFRHLKVGVGQHLDPMSSGVFVLGVGNGNKLLPALHNAHLTRTYTVCGLFGKATDDFSDTGKLIEKATFDHITREQLERIISVIQGSNHKALLQYANIDLKTQEAYELAVKGLIRPMEKSPPLITAVRSLHFAPPEFQLEIHCLHETQQYLRKIVHEIGLEMKSVAVCTQVRRVRDGVFTLEDALLRTQWNLHNIQNAILKSKLRVETEIQKSLAYEGEEETRASPVAGGMQLSEGEGALLPSSGIKL
ncbi:pseudouridylate synthase TRUB2, mitochondrial isoform X1 [Zootoca vivipara]|uniref:pseudouridylate synthase TRUB2, mitochondrial isoform X1 n=1 Tax=Zootoca vivipara TaxID=8524 RepID=UPI001591AC1A|nr:pseudouridylate synthase TRUB2, mitochondrial isoform X1 [Zootoca vivipara]